MSLLEQRLAEVEKHATEDSYGIVRLSNSESVTNSEGLALPASENNASIANTLAERISRLNSASYIGLVENNVTIGAGEDVEICRTPVLQKSGTYLILFRLNISATSNIAVFLRRSNAMSSYASIFYNNFGVDFTTMSANTQLVMTLTNRSSTTLTIGISGNNRVSAFRLN